MVTPIEKLLIATGNQGKLREFTELFGGRPIEIRSLADFSGIVEIEESGTTFVENAELKAVGYAKQTRMRTLADDSGLEVGALNGAPGVMSSRFGGKGRDYIAKISHLLKEIELSGSSDRSASFVSAIVIANELGETEFIAEGICYGSIVSEPRGTGGFGYDPIFVPDGYDLTFGELSNEIKAEISHRARATAIIMRYLGRSDAI